MAKTTEKLTLKVNEYYSKYYDELNKDRSQKLEDFIENKIKSINFDELKLKDEPEVTAQFLALHFIALKGLKTPELASLDEKIVDSLNDYLGFGAPELNDFSKTYDGRTFNFGRYEQAVKEHNQKEYHQKTVKEEQQKQEEIEKEQKKQEETREKERQEKAAGDKFYQNIDSEVPKYDPDKPQPKQEPKYTYSMAFVDSNLIESYLNLATNIYSGKEKKSIEETKGTFFKQVDDDFITEKINKQPKVDCNVNNVINHIAMYNAEKAKFNKMGFFRRTFSFFFKDASQLKKNMDALENSIKGMPSKTFVNIANAKSPHNEIHKFASSGHIGINDNKTKQLFDPNREKTDRPNFLEANDDLLETNDKTIEELANNQEVGYKAINDIFEQRRQEARDQLVLPDDPFEAKNEGLTTDNQPISQEPELQKEEQVKE